MADTTEPKAGERDAIARLTGTMFGPAVPAEFGWSKDELAELLGEETMAKLPEDWQTIWEVVVEAPIREEYGGIEGFRTLDPVDQSDLWYDFFDAVGLEEPPRQTCVMLTLTEPARRNLGRVIGRGILGEAPGRLFKISEECGVNPPPKPVSAPPPFSWLAAAPALAEPVIHIGGPPVDNVAIDEEGTITLVRLIGYSLVLGLVLSWVLLRSIRLMFMVFFVGGMSALTALGMVWWSNASVDAVLLTMPSLVYVLGIAGAIHIVNYYRDAVMKHGIDQAPERAISHAVMPCTLAAVTTAIGLLSLCASNILPIRKFGIFSAMGVMATLVLLYIYLPSALTIFPPKVKAIKEAGERSAQGILSFWEAIGRFILRRHWFVNAACIAVFVWLGMGLFKIETSVQLLKLFDSQAQIIKDYAWLEQNFGRLVPMEVVVRFPQSLQGPVEASEDIEFDELKQSRVQMSVVERAEAVAQVQNVLQNQFGYAGENVVGRGMSPVTLLPEIPKSWKGINPFRSATNRLIHQKLDQLKETDYLAVEEAGPAEGTELWRISIRLGALSDGGIPENGEDHSTLDYGEFVSALRAAVEPVVVAYRCRQEILQSIVGKVEDDDERLRGTVLVLGHPRPLLEKQTESGQQPESTGAESKRSEHFIENVDRTAIFADTLARCLVNETITAAAWHDPQKSPLDNGKAISAEWAEWIAQFDTIVVLDKHEDYDFNFIRQHNPHLIDASQMLAEISVDPPSDADARAPVEMSTREGEMDVVYTGVVPVVYKAQRTLLVSLIESVAWAFGLIAIVMICLLSPARSVLGAFHPLNFIQAIGSGAISMIPNVFPVVIIFGIMGHQGTLVDIGSMMTASVAMGVAVDDTIHFLTWFRQGLRQGLDRRDAIFVAYKHVAPAMTQTTIIGGLGLSVFALSTFTPTQRFGTLMLALLAAALVGDLIFLPALLASPLGRIFSVRPKKGTGQGSSDQLSIAQTGEEDEYKLAEDESETEATPQLKIRRPQMFQRSSTTARKHL